jgi:hypothetical protein
VGKSREMVVADKGAPQSVTLSSAATILRAGMKPSLERDFSTDCGTYLYSLLLIFEEELDQTGYFL